MASGATFAIVARQDTADVVVMLVDNAEEAQEIAAGIRRSGQRVDVERYDPARALPQDRP